MEVVSNDLVRRYEKLRTGDGDDVDGCAICRDDLLNKPADLGEISDVVAMSAALPFHPERDCIVAFPCSGKHLFHRDCLSPWLARKTTCPTCRFDIDPLSLTLQISRGASESATADSASEGHPSRVWQHPQVESMSDWLSAEEQAQTAGIPRQRPAVRMPECESICFPCCHGPVQLTISPDPPLPPRTVTDSAPGAAPRRPVRPPGNSFLTELLRFESVAFDGIWNFDPAVDVFHQEPTVGMRNSGLFRFVPPQPPSAPPVPASDASSSTMPLNPPSPPADPILGQPSGDPLQGPITTQRMLELLSRPGPIRPQHSAPWRPAPSVPPRDAPPHPANLTELHDSPLVLSPPPSGFDVDVPPLISEGQTEPTPVAAPAYFRVGSSTTTTSSSETRTVNEDGRTQSTRTSNVTTTYLDLVRSHAEMFLGSDNGPGTFSTVLARNAAQANSFQGERSPATSPPTSSQRPSPSPSPPSGIDDYPSTGYNPADDLD